MTKIIEAFPQLKKYDCPFGIELEVEFEYLVSKPTPKLGDCFVIDTDGSLRMNGFEVITREFPQSQTHDVCKSIINCLEKSGTPVASSRCGLHVHVNVQQYTLEQFFNLVCNFLAIEEYFIPDSRRGLLFCMSGRYQSNPLVKYVEVLDKLGGPILVKESDKKSYPFNCSLLTTNPSFVEGQMKYSATNISCTPKLGSIEFRFMESTLNDEDISSWAEGLFKMCETLKDIPASVFLNECLQVGTKSKLLEVIPAELTQFVNENVSSDNDYRYLRTLVQTHQDWWNSWFTEAEVSVKSPSTNKYPKFYNSERYIEFKEEPYENFRKS